MAIIRKQRSSFWDTIHDWLLHVVEDYELIDWNRISEATSWPCALTFNGLFILVSLARKIGRHGGDLDAILDSDSRHRPMRGGGRQWDASHIDYGVSEDGGTTWANLLLFLQVLMYLISIANAWRLFSARRPYQLRMVDADTTKLTSSCRQVPLGVRRPGWTYSFAGRAVWAVWKRIARIDDQPQGSIWELSLWAPTTFSRNLFCWYSPVQLLILSFMNGSNWYYIVPLAAAVAVQCTFVVLAYSQLVKDKQILFGEMYNEYNENFVNPRVFAPKSDAATSTMEDWALARRANQGPSNFVAARTNLERLRGNDSMRRRTTALVTNEAEPRNRVRQDVYRRATDHRSVQAAVPPPAPYVNTYGSEVSSDTYRRDTHDRRSHETGNFFQKAHLEPSGSHRIRDRTARRRRHTELVESAKYGQ
ncbi:hypothetical protein IWW54_005329 [Coemansia sp. RSA 2705]|nr:hypothetical protein IWW54_005329 [Coemansia sp. RSA 2705]